MNAVHEPGVIRSALRLELEARGYSVARDTAGARGELYIWGDGDRAAALFEFKETADDACLTMYQGSWLPTLPPRFAVMPAAERLASSVEILLQAGLSVLFYAFAEEKVDFIDLEAAVAEIARRGAMLG
jgi:hypothetical protein